ncbi:hypothetical protein AYI70_g10928 [Smittium culicis]|uniref:Uncharacterized protein n=1 Tax=Smittium culicis TaxID=133412 RepID=A0A1R1X483_9FUNG|nr:hypothetical protein AYI70_g11221 [Smittium culicis]OMJ09429.1 hypothetical protein AYI70_g10928 [Smittium culicis]
MSLLVNVLTGGFLFGGARAYAVALQGRPLFQKLGGYYLWVSAGALVGYGSYTMRQKLDARIETRYKELCESRDQRNAQSAKDL